MLDAILLIIICYLITALMFFIVFSCYTSNRNMIFTDNSERNIILFGWKRYLACFIMGLLWIKVLFDTERGDLDE